MSTPIDFRANFSGIAEAAAAWRAYQGALGGVIQSESSMAASQARVQQGLASIRNEAQATAASLNAMAPAMQKPFQVFTSGGQLSAGIKNVGQEFTALSNTVKSTGPPLANLNQQLDMIGTTGGKMGEKVAGTSRNMKTLAFGFLGMTTAGAEAVGMMSMFADTQALVSDRQKEVDKLLAEGMEGTQRYNQAVQSTEKAERFAAMTRRNLMLSMFDMIPFTVITINGLKEMGIGMNTLTGLMGKATQAFKGLSLAMKGALIGSGIGIALVAAGLLFEHFSQQAEAATTNTGDSMKELDTAIEGISGNFEDKTVTMQEAIDGLAEATARSVQRMKGDLSSLVKEFPNVQTIPQQGPSNATPQAQGPQGPVVNEHDTEVIEKHVGALKTLDQQLAELTKTTIAEGRKALIEWGFNLDNVMNISDDTAIAVAALNKEILAAAASGDLQQVNALLEKRAEILGKDLETPLQKRIVGTVNSMADLAKGYDDTDKLSIKFAEDQKKAAEALRKYHEEMDKGLDLIPEIITTTDQQTRIQETAEKQLFDLTKGKQEQIQVDKQVHDGLLAQVDAWAELPKGMQFTTETLQKANDTYLETHDVQKATAVLMADENAKRKEAIALINEQVKAMDPLVERFGGAQSAAQAANEQFSSWFMQMRTDVDTTQALNKVLLEQAASFGIDLPAGIKLTNEELQLLINNYYATGSAAGAMADIHAERFAELHKVVSDLVDKAIEGGKEWSKAWKEVSDNVPKDLRGFMKGFIDDMGDLQAANSELETTLALLDSFLDWSNGQMNNNQIDDWGNKIKKSLDNINDAAGDLPFTNEHLDSLIKLGEKMASQADSADDFRPLIAFLQDLNAAVASGDSDKIDQLYTSTQNLMNLFGHLPKPQELDAFTNAIGDVLNLKGENGEGPVTIDPAIIPAPEKAEDFDTKMAAAKAELLSLSGTSDATAGGGKTAGITLDPVVVPAPNHADADIALQDSQTAFANLSTEGSNSVALLVQNIRPHIVTLATYFGTTVVNAINAASKELIAFKSLAGSSGGGNSGFSNVDFPFYGTDENGNPKSSADIPQSKNENLHDTTDQDYQAWQAMKTDMQTPIAVPSPNLSEFIAGINTASEVGFGFITTFNAAAADGILIGSPNLDAYIKGMDMASSIALLFITTFNNAMGGGAGGGGGDKGGKKKKGGGLAISAPALDGFIQGMDDASAITLGFITTFNNAMGGGAGGGKKKKKGGGLTISSPNIDPFIAGLDTASAVTLGFITTFNNAMGGGDSKNKKKGGGGLVIGAPDATAFEDALNTGINLTNKFVDDFTQGMDDMASAAGNAAGDITANFEDIQSAAEDAQSAVEDLQSKINKLKGKHIDIDVGIKGEGVKYLAKGFHGIVNTPTLMVVGEAGPEQVDVSATNQAPTGLETDRNVNINPIFTQSAKDLQRGLRHGINDLIDEYGDRRNCGVDMEKLIHAIKRQVHKHHIKVELNKKTLLDVIREELLDV